MLYLDKPIGPIRGMMIYADHADPDLFYYVPERPRLARNDGKPEFVLLKYRRDITDNPDFDPDMKQSLGGGFLAFTVDLGVEEDELKAIKKELGRYSNGEPKLVPIQFRKGSSALPSQRMRPTMKTRQKTLRGGSPSLRKYTAPLPLRFSASTVPHSAWF
jgi:hypothetical protein